MGQNDPEPTQHDRLNMLVAAVGGRLRAAQIAGVSGSTIDNWRKPGASVPLEEMRALAEVAGVSLDWLASGHSFRPINASAEKDVDRDEFVAVPRLNVEASAGSGTLATQEDEEANGVLAFRREWLRRSGIAPHAAQALTARGDSMEPTICDGDILLADTSIDRIIDNGIYVVVLAGLIMVKRVHPTRDGAVTLISDNPHYPDETVPADEVADLTVAGRVRWFGRSI